MCPITRAEIVIGTTGLHCRFIWAALHDLADAIGGRKAVHARQRLLIAARRSCRNKGPDKVFIYTLY